MATRYADRDYERRGMDRWDANERGLFDRAGDEVRSWFGDEEAERRRRRDYRRDQQMERWYAGRRTRADWDELRAGDVMTRSVMTVYEDETLAQAARLMDEGDCGALPVVDRNGRFTGMITDRDIAIRAIARGYDPRRTRVEACMSDETFGCHVNDSLRDCMRQMSRHQIRRLPIVNDHDQIIGILSQADLARHADEYQGQGGRRAFADTVAAVSEPTREAYR
jgi:CBS domain-containing protein